MSPDSEKRLEAAVGYYELGMTKEAWAEIDPLPPEDQEDDQVLLLRISILLRKKRWKQALPYTQLMIEKHPRETEGFIHHAYCLHELKRTEEARATLALGPKALRKNPLYFYNLACYSCALGELEQAQQLLDISFTLDPDLRRTAITDPDLKPLLSSDSTTNPAP